MSIVIKTVVKGLFFYKMLLMAILKRAANNQNILNSKTVHMIMKCAP